MDDFITQLPATLSPTDMSTDTTRLVREWLWTVDALREARPGSPWHSDLVEQLIRIESAFDPALLDNLISNCPTLPNTLH